MQPVRFSVKDNVFSVGCSTYLHLPGYTVLSRRLGLLFFLQEHRMISQLLSLVADISPRKSLSREGPERRGGEDGRSKKEQVVRQITLMSSSDR
jgi:hypothetical protein